MELRDIFPEPRSAEDVLAKRIRLVIDGTEYALPVLAIRENRVWSNRLDAEIARVFEGVEDAADLNGILAALSAAPGRFMDMLYLYDLHLVLPPREDLEAVWTEVDLLVACLEVWRAAHPLVDIGLSLMASESQRSSVMRRAWTSRPASGDGPSPTSRAN